MSKVTVITDEAGSIQAIGHGYLSEETARKSKFRQPQGGLRPLPGQHLQELEVPEDLEVIQDWRELHDKVAQHLKK